MKQILFTIVVLLSSVGFAQTSTTLMTAATPRGPELQKQLLKLSDGVERYVEFLPPKGNKPWIVFTNGLVYEIKRWGAMDASLAKQGYGILHYYYRGQDLTLRREVEVFKTPSFFQKGLTPQDFVQELKEIIQQMQIKDKVVMVGLSYGSHVAANFAQAYPRAVQQLVFLAPLVVPLERYQPQGLWLDWNLSWVRAMWGNQFYEYAYRQIYSTYLNSRVTADRVPDSLAKMPQAYRESLFHLVRVTRDFDLKKSSFGQLPPKSVHFMLAQEETPLAFQDQMVSFETMDAKSRGCLIWFPEAGHAIPDAEPVLAAKYLDSIIQKDPRLQQGKKYKSTSQGLTAW